MRRASLEGGRFHLRGLTPGVEHRLALWEVGDEGRYVRSQDVPALAAAAGSRDVLLEVEPRASVTLRVVDAETREPVEDFVLFAGAGPGDRLNFAGAGARDRLNGSALVDDADQARQHYPSGVATYEGLQPPEAGGVCDVRVVATGYEVLERRGVPLRRGEDKDLGTVALKPAPSALVRVTDGATGDPIEGARVVVATESQEDLLRWMTAVEEADPWANADLRAARTDAEGRARVGLVPAERCVVVAGAEGFLPSEPVDARATGEGESALELTLAGGGRIDVSVEDVGGAPVVGARVRYSRVDPGARDQPWSGPWGAGDATGPDGCVELGPLEAGTWRLRLASPGGTREAEPIEVVVVEAGRHSAVFQVPRRVTLEGVVTQGRVPLAGADLTLSPLGSQGGRSGQEGFYGGGGVLSGLSAHDGRYRIDDVPSGEYTLRVSHPERFMLQAFELTVGPDGATFDVELPIAVLEGTVRFMDGRPASGLRVDVRSADGRGAAWSGGGATLVEDDEGRLQPEWGGRRRQVYTEADGRYRFEGLATGVELTVSTGGAFSTPGALKGVVLAPDELRSDADLEVREAGCLALRLVGGQGSYRVKLSQTDADGRTTGRVRWTSVWRGRARRVDGLVPGAWTVEVHLRGVGEPVLTLEAQVVAGEEREVVLPIP